MAEKERFCHGAVAWQSRDSGHTAIAGEGERWGGLVPTHFLLFVPQDGATCIQLWSFSLLFLEIIPS